MPLGARTQPDRIRLAGLMEVIPDAVMVLTLEAGAILAANAPAIDLLGADPQQVIGGRIGDHVATRHQDALTDVLSQPEGKGGRVEIGVSR